MRSTAKLKKRQEIYNHHNHNHDHTKKHTTTKHGESAGTTASTTKKHTTTESKRLRLTYPVPSQTRITTAFQGYAGHSGAILHAPAAPASWRQRAAR